MCIVCIEVAKGTLNRIEARRALAELALDPEKKEHVREVVDAMNKEDKEKKRALRSPSP